MNRRQMKRDATNPGVSKIEQFAGDFGLVEIRPLIATGRAIEPDLWGAVQIVKMAQAMCQQQIVNDPATVAAEGFAVLFERFGIEARLAAMEAAGRVRGLAVAGRFQ